MSLKSVRIGGAVVSYDPQIAEPAGIVAAVEKVGYRVVGSSE